MSDQCPECGAPFLYGDSCRDNFHALLQLEWQVPDAPGPIVHFYAVSCYVLQHPDSMHCRAEALHALKASLGDALEGRATISDLRRRARFGVSGATRVTRREGDPAIPWRRGGWPITVADVCMAGVDGYVDSVLRWARSVRDTLAADQGT